MTDTTSTPLSASQRQQVIALIKTKESNVVVALEREVSANTDLLLRKALRERGYNYTSDDLAQERRELKSLKDQADVDEDPIVQELLMKIEDLDDKLRIEKESIRLSIRAQIDALEVEQRRLVREAEDHKSEKEVELNTEIENRTRELLDGSHPGMVDRLRELPDLIAEVRNLEREVDSEVHRQVRSIDQARSRLIHLVHDASASAQMNLLKVTTSEEAFKILEQIPTVAELIHIAEDPERGLNALVERLAPSHTLSLAAPKEEVEESTSTSEDLPIDTALIDPSRIVISYEE